MMITLCTLLLVDAPFFYHLLISDDVNL